MKKYEYRDGEKIPSFRNYCKLTPQVAEDIESLLYLKNDLAINILLNLSHRERTHKYIQKKLQQDCSDYICVYLRPIEYTQSADPIFNQAIIDCGLSYHKVKNAITLLKNRCLISIQTGYHSLGVGKSKMTTLHLNTDEFYRQLIVGMEINDDQYFIDGLSKIARIYSLVDAKREDLTPKERQYREMERSLGFAYLKNKEFDFDSNPLPIKRGKPKKVQFNKISEVDKSIVLNLEKINSAFGDNEEFHYKRIYGKSISEYGRFFSSLHYIPSALRNAVFEKGGYVECDFKSFNINAIWIRYTGHRYPGKDIYEDVVRAIPVLANCNEEKLKKYRKLIKPMSLTIFGVNHRWEAANSIRETLFKKFIKEINEEDVLLAFENVGKEISEHLYTFQSAWCQNTESNIMEKIALKMIEDGLLPWLIHDAFYIKKDFLNQYDILKEEILKEEILEISIQKIENPYSLNKFTRTWEYREEEWIEIETGEGDTSLLIRKYNPFS